jgi:ABC-2 type transport system permease protein
VRNILAICGKEMRGYFTSPIAYLLLAIFAVLFGYFFFAASSIFATASMESAMSGRSFPMNINQQIIAPLLGNSSVVMLFLIPMISMRLFAEEKRQGTMELLLTSPVRDWEIVAGKFLGAMLMFAAILLVSLIDIAFLFAYGNPSWQPIAAGYLGLLLQGGCLLAIGTYISTTTKNQIVAGGATFAVCLLLWVLSWSTDLGQGAVSKVVAYCSVLTHFEPFSKGIIDTKDVIFYLTFIFFGLFLTTRSLESLRWRA